MCSCDEVESRILFRILTDVIVLVQFQAYAGRKFHILQKKLQNACFRVHWSKYKYGKLLFKCSLFEKVELWTVNSRWNCVHSSWNSQKKKHKKCGHFPRIYCMLLELLLQRLLPNRTYVFFAFYILINILKFWQRLFLGANLQILHPKLNKLHP